MRKLLFILPVLLLLFCGRGFASECDGTGKWPVPGIHNTSDSFGTLHDFMCFDPFTGKPMMPSVSIKTLNNIQFADQVTGGLAAYLAAPAANTTLIVSSPQTISSSLAWSVTNLTIKCENNAVITFTSAGRLLPSGAGDGFEGCNFQGAGVGVTLGGAPIALNGGGTTGSQPGFFRSNQVSNFGPTGGNGDR